MTRLEAEKLQGRWITIWTGLELAFRAGAAQAIASHEDFKQIHLNEQEALEAIYKSIWAATIRGR
jgi:high-affinity Fe2+/Pb2+ permease